MSVFKADGDYIDGEVSINDPYTSVATIHDSLAETRAKAEEILILLIGDEGDGGLLGDMMAGLAASPSISIIAPTVDTSVALETSGQDVPVFDDEKLQNIILETYALPTLVDIPTIDVDFSSVVEPEDLSLTMSWAETTLPEELFLALKAKLLSDMANGATGINAEVEAAIYSRARNRQQIDRLTEWNRINDTAGAMQFAYPSGVLLAVLAGFSSGANRQDADIENTIIVAQADLAQKNTKSAIDQALSLETLLRQTRNEESNRALDEVKHLATLSVQDFANRVQRFIGVWEGRKTMVQAMVERLRGALETNKGSIDVFRSQYEALKTRIDAVTAYNKGQVDVFVGTVQGFGEVERAVSSRNESRVNLLAEQIKNADMALRSQIAEAEAMINAYTAEQSIRERITSGVSNIAAQVSASLLSAVHTSLGANYSASESANKSFSVSVGVSESHNASHDPEA